MKQFLDHHFSCRFSYREDLPRSFTVEPAQIQCIFCLQIPIEYLLWRKQIFPFRTSFRNEQSNMNGTCDKKSRIWFSKECCYFCISYLHDTGYYLWFFCHFSSETELLHQFVFNHLNSVASFLYKVLRKAKQTRSIQRIHISFLVFHLHRS